MTNLDNSSIADRSNGRSNGDRSHSNNNDYEMINTSTLEIDSFIGEPSPTLSYIVNDTS